MIRFLTLYTVMENVHLTKDVGMLPFVLYKHYGYHSTIASYENGDYPYLETEVKGLKQMFIRKVFRNNTLDSLYFVLCNFRKFDVLHCFHITPGSVLILFFFKALKLFTSKKFTYLKLDENDGIKKFRYLGVFGVLLKYMVSKIDLVSIETTLLLEYLNRNNTFGRPVVYIPNGFYTANIKEVSYGLKENVIITVGRIGTFEKANETLLHAFTNFAAKHPGWSLKFIGPITSSFCTEIDTYFESNPHLKDRIEFTGAIFDRGLLKSMYERSKIFVLTSRWEGFALVYLEALMGGCTIVSTDITPAYDVTDNQNFGKLFPIGDVKALTETLLSLVEDEEYLEHNAYAVQKFGYEKFYWPKIVDQINTEICRCIG